MVRNRSRHKSTRRRKSPPASDTALVYGVHAVRAALANPERQNARLWATADSRQSLLDDPGNWSESGAEVLRTAITAERPDISARLPDGAVHQGLLLEASPLADPGLASLTPGKTSLSRGPVVVLDQVSDPHNVGAILRSAAAFGARALVMQDRHTPSATGTLAKAASGALEVVPLVYVTNISRALDDLKAMEYWVVGLDAESDMPLAEAVDREPLVLVLGAEGSGLRRLTAEHCDLMCHIPIGNAVASLNVSNAAAIALYETSK